MYAIRSYYAMVFDRVSWAARPTAMPATPNPAMAAPTFTPNCEKDRGCPRGIATTDAVLEAHVITSYSIHYTKLYE